MNNSIKEDWLINSRNIFELDKIDHLSFFSIQREILDQIEDQNIDSITDFLNIEVDTTKAIWGTQGLSIDKIFIEYLKLENFNVLHVRLTHVHFIYSYLNVWLFRKYTDNNHKTFLTNEIYKQQYESLKNNYLNSHIDTDENDFITRELKICNSLVLELTKPVYNNIDILGNVEDEPTAFKKHISFTLDKRIKYLKGLLLTLSLSFPPVNKDSVDENENKDVVIRPTCKPEILQPLFEIIKDFFNIEQQNELKRILETFDNTDKKLLFKGNGNRLTDIFKKLIEHDFITGFQKKDLIEWTVLNFQFLHNGSIKDFKISTAEKSISGNEYSCKNPLIEIKNQQILRVEQPKSKKSK
ncbi:hypothetical protein [Chryseobacterium fistulae]|uniref:Uncharacterized protein n=1 Tax=Chryseobacterium fistulae TaxID=2675058 RepID=A0A6N4XUK4_9FLAO|nr:hypothetical protein [Chryseobacterium fistulae]CAA7386980.1 hypothetical protein CHRY9393_01281 [Chryseobacterium fistulae]